MNNIHAYGRGRGESPSWNSGVNDNFIGKSWGERISCIDSLMIFSSIKSFLRWRRFSLSDEDEIDPSSEKTDNDTTENDQQYSHCSWHRRRKKILWRRSTSAKSSPQRAIALSSSVKVVGHVCLSTVIYREQILIRFLMNNSWNADQVPAEASNAFFIE